MKKSQKLKVKIENIDNLVRFEDMDKKLLPLVARLEVDGDEFGPVVGVIDGLCVAIKYADKSRGPVKPTIFGYDSDEFLEKQYS